MENHIGDDLKKLALAGLGAAALAAEKSAQWIDELAKKGKQAAKDVQPVIDDLAQKGESALEKGAGIGQELKDKLTRTFNGCVEEARQMDVDEIKESLLGLTDEGAREIRAYLDAMLSGREKESENDS